MIAEQYAVLWEQMESRLDGYLYNYCAAMNGQYAACQRSSALQPNQSVNGGTSSTLYNICPLGWRLPTGEYTTGEFTLLNNSINGGSKSSTSSLFANGLYMYSGGWNSVAFSSQGTYGRYRSSTIMNVDNNYNLVFSSGTALDPGQSNNTDILNPADYGHYGFSSSYAPNKNQGRAIRCVAP